MKIGEVAADACISVDAIRFYERRGVLPPAPRLPSGYRDYPDSTVVSAFSAALGNQSLPGLGNVSYSTYATLLSMNSSGGLAQTWQITSQGSVASLRNATAAEQRDAQHMNTALWQATWGYFLLQMLGVGENSQNPLTDDDIAWVRRHFIDYVRASLGEDRRLWTSMFNGKDEY